MAQALDAEDDQTIGYVAEPVQDAPSALWLTDAEAGDPEHVIAFALWCAEAFDLKGRWGLCWALTASRPHLDAFGGGAQILDLGTPQKAGLDRLQRLARRTARGGSGQLEAPRS